MNTSKIVMTSVALAAIAMSAVAENIPTDRELTYPAYSKKSGDMAISRSEYHKKLQGFWLGQCIANWTGLTTEGQRRKAPFYTDENWGDVGKKGRKIEFILVGEGAVWGADDDTDIEYIYQDALDTQNTSILTPENIRDAWLKHIKANGDNPHALWVSNAAAWKLMRLKGMVPPLTSDPRHNRLYDMIDAQLTTEIFGLFAPARPDTALKIAHLPIRTTAYQEAEWMAEFYVIMHSLASSVDPSLSMQEQTVWLAEQARRRLPDESIAAHMYDFVKKDYEGNPNKDNWEKTRDAVYQKYQVEGEAGYRYKEFYDAGINFAASIISLFYGEGDFKRTVRIGALCGWDSDNPTATWGGLLGFMIGPDAIEEAFGGKRLSRLYHIARTRVSFPDRTPDRDGDDAFELMALRGVHVIDRVIIEEMGGGVDLKNDVWWIPSARSDVVTAEYVPVPDPKRERKK